MLARLFVVLGGEYVRVIMVNLNLPVAEVASALGVAEGTVNRHLSDAMTRLAARLAATDSEQRGRSAADAS